MFPICQTSMTFYSHSNFNFTIFFHICNKTFLFKENYFLFSMKNTFFTLFHNIICTREKLFNIKHHVCVCVRTCTCMCVCWVGMGGWVLVFFKYNILSKYFHIQSILVLLGCLNPLYTHPHYYIYVYMVLKYSSVRKFTVLILSLKVCLKGYEYPLSSSRRS